MNGKLMNSKSTNYLPMYPKSFLPNLSSQSSCKTRKAKNQTRSNSTPSDEKPQCSSTTSRTSSFSMTSYLDVPNFKPTKSDAATQTVNTNSSSYQNNHQMIDSKPKIAAQICAETQTDDFPLKKPDVIVDIPEKLLENIFPKHAAKTWSPIPYTELVSKKIGDTWRFNFIGAFFNFDGMDREEIIKTQKMLNETFYEVCERAANSRRVKHTKTVLSA